MKKLRTFVFLQILIEFITFTNSEVVRCAFQYKNWDDFVGKPYTCVAMNVNFPTKIAVDKVSGRHRANHGNNNVQALDITNQQCEHFPGDFNKIFSNLEGLAIVNSKLKSISKKDLEVFPKLKTINFSNNEIKQLGFALLTSNPLLKKISFAGNPLIGIGSDLLDNFEGLEQVDFSNAGCIDSKGASEDEIETIKGEINEKCPATDEMRSIQESDMKFYFCRDQLDNATASVDVCNVHWENCVLEYEKLEEKQKECESQIEVCEKEGAKECNEKVKALKEQAEVDAAKIKKLEAQIVKLKEDSKELKSNYDRDIVKLQTCKADLKKCSDPKPPAPDTDHKTGQGSGCIDQLQIIIECDQFYGTTCVSESSLIPFEGMTVGGVKLPNGTVVDGSYITELQLSGGAIRAIPDNFGQYFANLVTLIMDNVRVEDINKHSFNGSRKLTNLTMTNGKLTNIHKEAFISAQNIITIDFTKNELTEISEAIQNLVKLQILIVESNQINTIEWKKFGKLKDIEVISVNNNPLEHVDSGFLNTEVFTNLVSVDMMGSKCINLKYPSANAEKIKQALYKDCPFKVSVQCDYKKVGRDYVCEVKEAFMYYENTIISGITGAHLSEDKTVADVTKLIINGQVMHYIPSNLIKQFGKVEKLEIDNSGLLEISHLTGLKEVVIINNNVTTIDDNSFSGSPDVEVLTLTGNKIAKITDGAFANNKDVLTFDISNNQLANFTSTSIQTVLTNGATINLSGNQLTNVVWSYTAPTTSQIIATGNQCIDGKSGKNMQAFVKSIQESCSQKEELECEFKYFDDDYACVVKDLNIISENTKITRVHGIHTESGMTSKTVTKLIIANQNMEYFPINIAEVFPGLQKVEVTSSNLRKISNFVGKNLEWIKITGNKIEAVEGNSFVDSPALNFIDISNNEITKIPRNVFDKNLELLEVNLSNNRLETINWAMFTVMTMLQTVDVSYNKLKQIDWTQITTDLESIDLTGNECINMKYSAEVKDKFMDAINNKCGRETTLSCKFKKVSADYVCYTINLQILNENTRITSIEGKHVVGKTNKDVTRFVSINQNVVYFPINIRKFFTILKVVDIVNQSFRLKVIFLSDTEFTKTSN
ncbi:unnamed protein product [Chironomus riparius]|uniref:Uncharacterized protein n=1 Tax=Chironomus riparius TaxID=315576 RepID=A0A9N9S5Y8_9DIPT|nr:unnamed protein product [Chironomus riparius]